MFSKAVYDPAKACAVQGLVERSVPGRYTPRKLAETPTAPITADVAAADHNSNNNNNINNNNNNNDSFMKHTVDSRGMLSTPAPTAVFRVIPTGLGYRSTHRAGFGVGGSVPGIAPLKRFSGSQSAPTLGQEEPQARNSRQLPSGVEMPHKLLLPLRSTPKTAGGTVRDADSKGHRSRRAGGGGGMDTNSKKGDQESTPAATEPSSSTRRRARSSGAGSDRCDTGSGGRSSAEESGRNSSALSLTPSRSLSRSLSRSHSDYAEGRRCGEDVAARENSHDAPGTGTLQKSSSLERFPTCSVDGRKGSGRSRCDQSRGETPAQRRTVDQLALDFAAVRSLES